MLISARKDDTDVRILANPRIRVKNREKAKVLIGDRVPVITTTSTATGFVADSVSYVDVGLKLEVEPNIFLDEEVSMKIQMEVSSIVNQVISKSGTLSYQIGTRNANTVLRLRDGETQVLAGLINDEDRRGAAKVPGLGDLPLLGRLFSSHNGDAQKTELVLSITPRLVRTIRRPDMINAMFESGTETSLSGKSLSMGASSVDSEKGGVKASQNTANSTQPRNAVNGQGGSASQAKAVAIPDAPQQKELSKPEPKSQSGLSLNWTGPSQVKPGEQFNVTLNIGAESAIAGVAALLGFDPAYLQVVSVSEGDFLKQGGSDSRFSNRIDPVSGKVFLANIRMDGQVTGKGSLAMLSFKAVQATDKASIQLLSMTPETGTGGGDPLNVPMPADLNITVN